MKVFIDGCGLADFQTEAIQWHQLLPELVARLKGEVYVLNRQENPVFPNIEGLKNLFAPAVDRNSATEDRRLAALCRSLGIDVFISTGDTTAGIDVESLVIVDSRFQGQNPDQERAIAMASRYIVVPADGMDYLKTIDGVTEETSRVVPLGNDGTLDYKSIAENCAIAIQELLNQPPTAPLARRLAAEEAVKAQASHQRRLAAIQASNQALGQDREIVLQAIASITDRDVKQRVYSIISQLEPDHWLNNDLATYSESIQTIDTWFDSVSFLNWYAHNFRPKNYLEVGVRRGRSIAQVLVESPETEAYGFDLWIPDYASVPQQGIQIYNPGSDFVQAELRKLGVKNLPALIQGNSHEALPAFFANTNHSPKFDLIFIDGDHTYEGAKLDLDTAFDHLADGGVLVFDDITHHAHPELRQLWNEYKAIFSDYLFFEDVSGTGTGVTFKPPFTKLESFLATPTIHQPQKLTYTTKNTKELPIHFFTIVLNGEPFIRYHIDIFKELTCQWHWHIVEGVAELKHDTGWSIQSGGKITDDIHNQGRSNDGTTQYLDELVQLYPENITIYRQPEGVFWDGKRAMVNAPLENIQEKCLLWQVDVDELWSVEQIGAARKMFIQQPLKTAAFYWCWYFVGENLVISTRNCYAENPQQEWLRTWRFKPGYFWAAHEPPILVETLEDGQLRNIAAIDPFLHDETEKKGLVFQHFAYVTLDQLRFKEQYYGYTNAVSQWATLQSQSEYPVLLRQFFAWVQDETLVDTVEAFGIEPIAKKEPPGSLNKSYTWRFTPPKGLKTIDSFEKVLPQLIIDGVFFQLYKTGIARVWKSLFEEWAKTDFVKHILVLDRAGTATKVPGIRYRIAPPYDYDDIEGDRQMLQQVCDEENADVFISTYYTTPLSTPHVLLVHDMIPEIFKADPEHFLWRGKHYAIQKAAAWIAVSENTGRDLSKFFPAISAKSIEIAHNGIKSIFSPASTKEISQFKMKYGIFKPYFLMVGAGIGHKNSMLFFNAFNTLFTRTGFEIVCTRSGTLLETNFRAYTSGVPVHMLQLSDEELIAAYSGAVALVYPSNYEGFGLPVLEALACGCPVITCPNGSIPEVAGEAALYIGDRDVNGLSEALCEIQKPQIRTRLIAAGLEQAKKFSWSKMAEKIASVLIKVSFQQFKLRETNFIIFPDWSQSEEIITEELEQVLRAIATHQQANQTTLLITINNIAEDDAELILSGVAMNLLMEDGLDISEGLEISLVTQLSSEQWASLASKLKAKIRLKKEVVPHQTLKLPVVEINNLYE